MRLHCFGKSEAAQVHMSSHAQAHVHTHEHMHLHMSTCTCTQAHVNTHEHMQMSTCTWVRLHMSSHKVHMSTWAHQGCPLFSRNPCGRCCVPIFSTTKIGKLQRSQFRKHRSSLMPSPLPPMQGVPARRSRFQIPNLEPRAHDQVYVDQQKVLPAASCRSSVNPKLVFG